MGISELGRRVDEYNSLIKSQLRLIRKLEKRNKDLTSARIVFDSLRFSLFLATHDWHRARCQGEQPEADIRPTSSSHSTKLVVLTHADHASRGVGWKTTMKAEENVSAPIDDKNKESADSPAILAKTGSEPTSESSRRYFNFRPLTEDEKREFAKTLSGEGRLKLIDPAETRHSIGSAA